MTAQPAATASPPSGAVSPADPALIAPGRRPADSRQSASSLVDEAIHRLRVSPAATLGIYYAGALPFVLALLYFWADMSHSADAATRGPGAALLLAVLFVGMKTAQAVFAARLRAQFAREPMPRWSLARLGRVVLVQAGWQAPGLFVLQAAAVVLVPMGWVYAFYQNVTALGNGERGLTAREVGRRAWRQALVRPRSNHSALSILCGLGFFAWLALLLAAFVLPQLVQMFTGEDNVFTRDASSLLNTTLLFTSVALVYLALDPLIKTFYALRCFYEDSARTGEDLLSELRALPPVAASVSAAPAAGTVPPAPVGAPGVGTGAVALARVALALALLGSASIGSATARSLAATSSEPAPGAVAQPAATPVRPLAEGSEHPVLPSPVPSGGPETVSPTALGHSIHEVLGRREFAWRSPRPPEPADAHHDDAMARFVEGIRAYLRDAYHSARELMAKLRHWLHRDEPTPVNESKETALPTLQPLAYIACGLLAALIVYLVWSLWLQRQRARRITGRSLDATVGRPLPTDLLAEDLLASEYPEDEWLTLARRLAASGERRLALRALYLSLLAGLGQRGLLAIARHKSNRDYIQELRRRARDRPELAGVFGQSVRVFERVWYGAHPVEDGLIEAFDADRAQVLG